MHGCALSIRVRESSYTGTSIELCIIIAANTQQVYGLSTLICLIIVDINPNKSVFRFSCVSRHSDTARFAAERRAAAAGLLLLRHPSAAAIDRLSPQTPARWAQQQTYRSGLQTDRQTDGLTPYRYIYRAAYYASSVNKSYDTKLQST